MKNYDNSALSKDELIIKVNQLESEIDHNNNLLCKVREHKHNYSEDFGLVVSAPIQALMKELLDNPSIFSEDEKKQILDFFQISMLHRGIYECLGWPIDIQLKRVKESIVPQIHNNVDLYTSVIRKTVEFCNHSLVSILRMAIGESEALCSNLINIEHFDYGPTTTFCLSTVIKETFDQYNLKTGSLGEIPIHVEYYFGKYNDVKVSLNQKGFCKYFLDNMIKNLKDHAFKEIDELLYSQKEYEENDSWWTKLVLRLLPRLLPHRLARRIDIMLRPVSPSTQILIPEKTVRIWIKPDKNDLRKVNLIIENNGKPFIGDTEKVFENGIGEGSGIGLYSTKQFLKAFGATIKMFTDNSNEYKVGFIINLPIL